MNTTNRRLFTIPNVITLFNILSGCISIVCAFNNNLILGGILIFIAGVLDFFDGLAARFFNAYSELGKQLDSLADVISFGVAPSVIIYQLLLTSLQNKFGFTYAEPNIWQFIILYSAFLIALFSALRLAKFNIDDRQHDSFIGMPTPANAFLFASLPFVINDFPELSDLITNLFFLVPLVLITSFLLISEIPLISIKFKNFSIKENISRYLLLFISLVLFMCFRISAYPAIFFIYIAISIFDNRMINKKL